MPGPDSAGEQTLHHFGIVVASIEDSVESVCQSMQAAWTYPVSFDALQKVRVTFLEQQNSPALIELVEPASPDSPVARFLKAGGGLNHLCYEVDRIESQIETMKKRGAMLIRSPKPAVAFDGRRIAWMMTKQKVLIEYLERTKS